MVWYDFQAELRALEEGDGSNGGSSPCSEASQDAIGSQDVLLKKSRWKTAFPHAPSPDSNSRGSDLPESAETGKSEFYTNALAFNLVTL